MEQRWGLAGGRRTGYEGGGVCGMGGAQWRKWQRSRVHRKRGQKAIEAAEPVVSPAPHCRYLQRSTVVTRARRPALLRGQNTVRDGLYQGPVADVSRTCHVRAVSVVVAVPAAQHGGALAHTAREGDVGGAHSRVQDVH